MPQTPPSTVIVCVNRRPGHGKPSCVGRGSETIADALEAAGAPLGVEVTRLKCFGHCAEGPSVRVHRGPFFRGVTLENVDAILTAALGRSSGAEVTSPRCRPQPPPGQKRPS